eukprot:3800753-Lingulodinium_polyedra.AAC.1
MRLAPKLRNQRLSVALLAHLLCVWPVSHPVTLQTTAPVGARAWMDDPLAPLSGPSARPQAAYRPDY